MSTALALDSSPSTAAAHFFRALGRVKCGHITGALADLRICKNKLGSDSRAGSCANQVRSWPGGQVPVLRSVCPPPLDSPFHFVKTLSACSIVLMTNSRCHIVHSHP